MKHVVFVLTLLVEFISVASLKLLDRFELIIGIFIFCLLTGGLLLLSGGANRTGVRRQVGWGMFYASLTALGLLLLFLVWLSSSFPP